MKTSTAYDLIWIKGIVSHVRDGDTIDLELTSWKFWKTESLPIRFAGIDTPEKGQPFCNEAKQFVMNALRGHSCYVRVARTQVSKQYITGVCGRVIGIVTLSKWTTSLNLQLVRMGLARVYPLEKCSWMTEPFWNALLKATKHAQRKRLNLWETEVPEFENFQPQRGKWCKFLLIIGAGGTLLIWLLSFIFL